MRKVNKEKVRVGKERWREQGQDRRKRKSECNICPAKVVVSTVPFPRWRVLGFPFLVVGVCVPDVPLSVPDVTVPFSSVNGACGVFVRFEL